MVDVPATSDQECRTLTGFPPLGSEAFDSAQHQARIGGGQRQRETPPLTLLCFGSQQS